MGSKERERGVKSSPKLEAALRRMKWGKENGRREDKIRMNGRRIRERVESKEKEGGLSVGEGRM